MNRQSLIEALQNDTDQRVWQTIRNYSEYNWILGSNVTPPVKIGIETDDEFAQRCVRFAEQLQDTFYLTDNPDQPAPSEFSRLSEATQQYRIIELEARLNKVKDAWTTIRELVEADE